MPESIVRIDGSREQARADKLISVFKHNLGLTKPHLFNLAAQVEAAFPTQRWNIIIGEDTSGRLVTRFLRHVLQVGGVHIPTHYACTSYKTRQSVLAESYNAYAEHLSQQTSGPPRALVVSESIGTGSTLQFTNNVLSRYFKTVDFATVSSRFKDTATIDGNLYVGGYGARASRRVYRTFERAGTTGIRDIVGDVIETVLPLSARKALKNQLASHSMDSWPLTGLGATVNDNVSYQEVCAVPVAQLASDTRYRTVAHYCYEAMSALAKEYSEQ